IDPLKDGVVAIRRRIISVAISTQARYTNASQPAAEATKTIHPGNANFVGGVGVDIEGSPVGTHAVKAEPSLIDPLRTERVNVAEHSILISSVGDGSQKRVAANHRSQEWRIAEQRAQVAIAGEKLVVFADPMIHTGVEVVYVVSQRILRSMICLTDRSSY